MLLKKLPIAIGIALATTQVMADATNFDKFTPMTDDPFAGSLPESAPFQLSSSDFHQVNIVTRNNVYALPRDDSGNYDMHTVNENGDDAVVFLANERVIDIQYPVEQYPEKVKSFNFDKTSEVAGTLLGIKGQYLIFDTGVLNIRKFAGYKLTVSY